MSKVQFFIHCTNFWTITIFLIFKKVNKFSIVGKPRPSEILQWKIFWEKEELTLKKKKMKMSNFLCKIDTNCKFGHKKSSLIMKM